MNIHNKLSATFIAITLGVSSLSVNAGGIPTFDGANMAQSTITALNTVMQYTKQIEEYKTQLLQYENQLRNSLAPAAYIWAEAQKTMNDLQRTVNDLKSLKDRVGNIDQYLAQFGDVRYYQNADCYRSNLGCYEEFKSQREKFSELQQKASAALTKGIARQSENILDDSDKLQLLQSRAQTAQGQMEAIQYANQFAAAQNNQLLQLRQIMLTQMDAINTAQQVDNARRAQIDAETNKLHSTGNTMGLRP